MDGLTLCRKLQEDVALRHIPVVFVTATYREQGHQEFATGLGATRVLLKPFDAQALRVIVEEALGLYSLHKEVVGVAHSAEQRLVLVVDDEPAALQLAARVLQSGNIASVTAGSAQEAMALLRADPRVDVVLSDIFMPTTGGLEFLAQVRAEFIDRPWLQLLLITGQASVETAVAAMKLDASDYLLKPVDPKTLREAVTHALGRASSIRAIAGGTAGSRDAVELNRLSEIASELATWIGRLGPEPRDGEPSVAALNLLRHLHEARSSIFGPAVMPEPAWEMLAELMRARLAGQRLSVTSLALVSSSPMTTALRRIDDLVQGGLVTRVPDPKDRRRAYLELTPTGLMRMRLFLEGFAKIVAGSR
jgi:CheY-like chemotaxis protein/DNA-binding MarR family transcriptional regulator